MAADSNRWYVTGRHQIRSPVLDIEHASVNVTAGNQLVIQSISLRSIRRDVTTSDYR